jgi:hypothetical protein
MALLQGIKKLFGPLLENLDCVSAVKEAMELQEEEGGRRGGSCKFSDTNVEENPEDDWFGSITQAPSARARTS